MSVSLYARNEVESLREVALFLAMEPRRVSTGMVAVVLDVVVIVGCGVVLGG